MWREVFVEGDFTLSERVARWSHGEEVSALGFRSVEDDRGGVQPAARLKPAEVELRLAKFRLTEQLVAGAYFPDGRGPTPCPGIQAHVILAVAVYGAAVHPVGDTQASPPESAIFKRNGCGLGVNYFSKSRYKITTFFWVVNGFVDKVDEGILGHAGTFRAYLY